MTNAQELSRTTTICNELGLHARAAARIAEIAGNAAANIWLVKDNQKADASSIVDILTLACEKGTEISIIIENPSDTDILNALIDLVDGGFGE
ncbi:MAG: HPr family phosphocarrier protein [Desulfobacterales bacterium]|jgi:phosphocarrier protein HPr